ncbi:flagellar basal body L-ring protein FlgH [Nitrincola iocasae]|jgi:flagellar L-ring protein precursor FlgH|uniref:Flagellar L-ring protein n=1 Tax=Nitrincola iocasae TaxID=2614693 RepID=A0A5J6LGM8_9GAMM|nr:flagellar basal body L-ring protein FlgH [Nitrincola iocasae]QEW07747.1 flagellar basal body L-ring protein FlgH [Nitrincola iocasae]
MKRVIRLSLVTAGLLVLAGCVNKAPKPDNPYYAPVQMPSFETPKPINGAIYHASTSRDIYSDGRAHRVGDIITINLSETTQSSKQSSTSIDKSTDINLPVPNVMGQPLTIGGRELSAGVSGETEFEGDSSSKMSNQLSGNITVTVQEIYPNGVMLVRGEKWLTLNQGDEYIRISGLVRPQDITADNSLDSTRLADARITYSGTGATADANVMGWLGRFFISALMPF